MRPGVAEAARLQVPLSIVILPRGDSKAKSPRIFQFIRSLCVQNGLDFIDISAHSITWKSRIPRLRLGQASQRPGASRYVRVPIRDAILRRGKLPDSRHRRPCRRATNRWRPLRS